MQKESEEVVVIENLESLKIKFWAKHCQGHNRDLSNAGYLTKGRVNNIDFVSKRGEVKMHFLQF